MFRGETILFRIDDCEKLFSPDVRFRLLSAQNNFSTPAEVMIEKIVFLGCQVLIPKSIQQFLKKEFSIGFWKVIDNKKNVISKHPIWLGLPNPNTNIQQWKRKNNHCDNNILTIWYTNNSLVLEHFYIVSWNKSSSAIHFCLKPVCIIFIVDDLENQKIKKKSKIPKTKKAQKKLVYRFI